MPKDTEAKTKDTQLFLARSSWIATLVAFGGNIFTAPLIRAGDSPVVGMLVNGFWSLFMLYGAFVGIYAIGRGCSPQHRKCLKHGLIGAALNIFLIVSAFITFQKTKEIARQRAEQSPATYSSKAADGPTGNVEE